MAVGRLWMDEYLVCSLSSLSKRFHPSYILIALRGFRRTKTPCGSLGLVQSKLTLSAGAGRLEENVPLEESPCHVPWFWFGGQAAKLDFPAGSGAPLIGSWSR